MRRTRPRDGGRLQRADRNAGHVEYADEAYNVGRPPASDSYLDQETIVNVAERVGADAIHPGYGCLAENAEFARRVESADVLTWVGPPSDAMETLGEKTKARSVMQEADVPVVPGTTEPVDDPEEVRELGEEYGYPIAIMGPEAAINAVYARKLAEIDDPEERERAEQELRQRSR